MSEKLRRGKERLLDGWDSLWEKLTSKIPRLPRPWRVARNLVCIVFGVYLIWLLLGGRALTPEWAFRREEQKQMVGPSEILGTFEVATNPDFPDRTERYIVGETEGELLVCQIFGSWSSGYSARLYVWEKSETMTLALLADGGTPFPDDGKTVYFLGYTELPGAVRAELDLTAQDEEEDEIEQWHVTAELENRCLYFPLKIFTGGTPKPCPATGARGWWRPPTPCASMTARESFWRSADGAMPRRGMHWSGNGRTRETGQRKK